MPKVSNNQKQMSSSEKEKLAEGTKAQKEVDAKDRITIRNAKEKLFELAKADLPKTLEQRTNDLVIAIENSLEDVEGLKATRIHKLISSNVKGRNIYTADELSISFDAYRNMIEKINEKVLYVPSRGSYCAFIGVSTNTFENYLVSPDDEKREIAMMINDYINTMMLDSGKMRKTDASVTIYEMKAIQKQAETTSPQVVNISGNVNMKNVNELIDRITQGKTIDAEFNEKEKK